MNYKYRFDLVDTKHRNITTVESTNHRGSIEGVTSYFEDILTFTDPSDRDWLVLDLVDNDTDAIIMEIHARDI